jgi:hypothetical protein
MRRTTWWLGILATVAGVRSAGVAAQTPGRRPAAQAARFVLVRYTSTGTVSAYGAYGAGPVAALVGLVRTPRTGAQTFLLGAGTRLRLDARTGIAVFAALADGTGGPSVRFYALPSVRVRRWELSGTATAQMGLGGGGVWKASLDPLTVSARMTPALGVGAAVVFRREADGAVVAGLGPAVAMRVAGTSLRGEVVRTRGSGGLEARVTAAIAY